MLRATRFVTQVPRTNYLQKRISIKKINNYVQKIKQLEKYKEEREKQIENFFRINLTILGFVGGMFFSNHRH